MHFSNPSDEDHHLVFSNDEDDDIIGKDFMLSPIQEIPLNNDDTRNDINDYLERKSLKATIAEAFGNKINQRVSLDFLNL